MMLKIKRNFCKRSNPNLHLDLSETGNEEPEKSGGCISATNNLPSTKKKRSYINLDGECDKASPPNKTPTKIKVFETEHDDTKDVINKYEVDEIDSDRSDKYDVKHGPLDSDQTDNNICDISQSSTCKHLPSQIPPTEKKKWPQKPCVYCRKYGTRHDTRYICSSCNIALCKSPCFSEYHSCK